MKCFFHPDREDPSGFEWTGPDPLSAFTQSEDIFLFMSAFFLKEEIRWVEVRLARLDQVTGDMIREHLFFLPRVESVMGNLCRIRGQMLEIVSRTVAGSMASSFRLSLWPRMEPLPYSNHLAISPLTVLPTMPPLNPSFFVHNLLANYS